MIDLKMVRAQLEKVREICIKRGCNVDLDMLLKYDDQYREITQKLESLRHRRKASKELVDRESAISLREEIKDLEGQLKTCVLQRNQLWHLLPNWIASDTPEGGDDQGNVVLHECGPIPRFDNFKAQSHEVIGKNLDILDLERGAKVTGAGFYYWKGDGARLVNAIFFLALEFLQQRGFLQMMTPILAKQETLFGTGYLPFAGDQIYRLEGEDLCLIGTSEQTLVGYHANEIIEGTELPLLYTAFTPCLRTEVGAYGKASKGAFRVHQFHKVEQIVFCSPEESEKWHAICLKNEQDFMEMLGIPYRVVRVCIGDLGAPAYKKYDVEGWFAGFGGYRETHSNTNLLDFQTRRLNIRCKFDRETVYPHTISATMITDRAALAILENNQQADGTVIIPEILRSFMNNQEVITKKGG